MFRELMPLIENRPLTITVAALSGGRIRVNVVPQGLEKDSKINDKVGYSNKDKIAKVPEAAINALTTPLSLTGTPEEIDESLAEALTHFFGTDAWRALAGRRLTEAQAPQLRRDLVKLYLDQLRTLWKHAGEMVDVYLRGEQRLYKMLFASDHPAANRIAGWIKKHTAPDTQGELFN